MYLFPENMAEMGETILLVGIRGDWMASIRGLGRKWESVDTVL